MPTGFHVGKRGAIGGDFSSAAGGAPSLRAVHRSPDAVAKSGGAAFSLDMELVECSQIRVPGKDERGIREAAELQMEALKARAGEGRELWLSYVAERDAKGCGVFAFSSEAFPLPSRASAFPSMAALHALALSSGKLKADADALVLFFMEGEIMSLTLEGGVEVFSRRFGDKSGLEANVRLSLQSVFFSERRRFIEVDEILVVASREEDFAKIERIFKDGPTVERFDVAGYFEGGELDASEKAALLLAYGATLAKREVSLAKWDFRLSRAGDSRKRKLLALRCAALLLLAPPLLLAVDIVSDKALLARVEKERESIAPLTKRMASLKSEVSAMKLFAAGSGRALIGPDICYDLFAAMDAARPRNLTLLSIAGNPYSSISVEGRSPDYAGAFGFIERLGAAKTVAGVELIYANKSDSGVVDFQFVVKRKFAKEFEAPPLSGEATR